METKKDTEARPNCVRCGKPANGYGHLYKTNSQTPYCFDCGWDWVKTTSRCPRCGKDLTDAEPYGAKGNVDRPCVSNKPCRAKRVTLDRGYTSVWKNS